MTNAPTLAPPRRLEALADGLARMAGYPTPTSPAYRLRNPGLLRNREGLRQFGSVVDGYRAFLADLARRCAGVGLHPNPTLLDLCRATGRGDFVARKAGNWCSRALDAEVRPATPLAWFLEN